MNKSGSFAEKWQAVFHSAQTDEVLSEEGKPETALGKAKRILKIIGKVIYHLRKVFMAIPVVYYALQIAAYNAANLPEMVGLNIQSDGSFAQMISRASAVNGPLILTGACLATMFLSRRTVYPWVISIFTLIVPLILLFTNLYPC